METETRIDGLVDRWEEMRDHGTFLSVDERCAACPELAAEARRRIEALQAMDSVLGTQVREVLTAAEGDGGGAAADYPLPEFLRAPSVYRPERFHRRGGLGIVFTARQDDLDRLMALKRIRPDKLRDQARRRFVREATLTAGLQHPGIVPIYGVGEDDGGPFYTMPFIEGQTLQEASDDFHGDGSLRGDPDRRGPRLRGLLQQFITVCNTVAYAHDQGVVHRDLKPSNVMLGPYGGTLVMDWGLAKRLDAEDAIPFCEQGVAAPSTLSDDVTATGDVLGTPQYMSPEAAKGEPAGPSGDIFSLVLVLYLILTGKSAFEESEFQAADRLKAVRDAAIVSPRRRDGRLPRALEAICLKALAARAADRYASARALADDFTRWLGDEPVEAWPEPIPARARRWGRRHRAAMAAAVMALLAGVIGLGAVAAVQSRANLRLTKAKDATSKALNAARKAQADTQAALEQSEESRKQTEAVSAFLVELFRSPDPSEDGAQVKVADLLSQAGDRLDERFAGTQSTRGALLDALGRSFYGLGLYDRAVNTHTKALAVRSAALGSDHAVSLASSNNLAIAYAAAGRLSEAIALHESTLTLREAKLGPDHPDTLTSRNNLAASYMGAGRPAEGVAQFKAVLELREAKLAPDHLDTLASRSNLASAYADTGRTAEAMALHESTLELCRTKLGPDHPLTLNSLNNLAGAYDDAGRPADAIPLHEKALELRRTKLGPDHPDTLVSRNNLAVAYHSAGRLAEAIALHEQALKLRELKLGASHPDTLRSRHDLATAYLDAGRTSEAIAHHRATLELRETKLAPNHPDTLVSRSNVAVAYATAGRLSEAIALHESTLERMEAELGPDHFYSLACRNGLATEYESLGRWAEAEHLYRDVLARRRKLVQATSPLLAGDLAALGRHLVAQSRWSDAAPPLRECLTIRDQGAPDDWLRFDAIGLLGAILLGQGRHTEAEPLVVAGYEGMKAREARIPAPHRDRLVKATERVIRLYEGWGKRENAAAWKDKLGMADLPEAVFSGP